MKTLLKTTITILFLSIILLSCNKNEPGDGDLGTEYYLTAKIQGAGYDIDYENNFLVLAINVQTQLSVSKVITSIPQDENTEFSFSLDYEFYGIESPETNYQSFRITIGESNSWATITALENDIPDANFTITKETDTYIEGVFSFIGTRFHQNTGEIIDTINVTNGKFKAKKTY